MLSTKNDQYNQNQETSVQTQINYSARERFFLWLLSSIGILILNSVFLWYLFTAPELILATLRNPIATVFIIESLLLMGFLAYLLSKWGVTKLHWAWFIALSLLGTMAFALPMVLLWRKHSKD